MSVRALARIGSSRWIGASGLLLLAAAAILAAAGCDPVSSGTAPPGALPQITIPTNSTQLGLDSQRALVFFALPLTGPSGQVDVLNLNANLATTNPVIATINLGHADVPLATVTTGLTLIVASGANGHGGFIDIIDLTTNNPISGSPFPFPTGTDARTGGLVFDPVHNLAIVSTCSGGNCTSVNAPPNGFAVFDLTAKTFGPNVATNQTSSFAVNPNNQLLIAPDGGAQPTLVAVDKTHNCTLQDANITTPFGSSFDSLTSLVAVTDSSTAKVTVVNLNGATFSGATPPCTLNEAGTLPNSAVISLPFATGTTAGISIGQIAHQAFVTSTGPGVAVLTMPTAPVGQITANMLSQISAVLPSDPNGNPFAATATGTVVSSACDRGFVLDANGAFVVEVDLKRLQSNPSSINTPLPAGSCGGGSTKFACSNGNGVTFFPLASSAVKQTSSGQGLIAIDPTTNTGFVPIYPLDANGDSQIAVVKLPPLPTGGIAPRGGAPVVPQAPQITLLSLPGTNGNHTIQPIASTFFSVNGTVLVEGRQTDSTVNVYVFDSKTGNLTATVPANDGTNPILQGEVFGGIIANPLNSTAIVAGTVSMGIMNLATSPPSFVPHSVIGVAGTDSFALNFNTDVLFFSTDGDLFLVDPTMIPPPVTPFQNNGFGTTDGSSFDATTNILTVSPEVGGTSGDYGVVFNFSALNTSNPATAPNVTVPGLGFAEPLGEGPGGQAGANTVTHQAVIADEFGVNFKLLQLPKTAITGSPNNNGQPGSGTMPDSNSAFTIAASIIPMATINGTPTQLGIIGDPNSLTIDQNNNLMYVLADTLTDFHFWANGNSCAAPPLFLVQVDLSKPVFGASPTMPTQWTPLAQTIQMPGTCAPTPTPTPTPASTPTPTSTSTPTPTATPT